MIKKQKPNSGSPDKHTSEKDTSPYVDQREKIGFDFDIFELPWTKKQKDIIELFLDKNTKILFLKGVAGTSKTLLSMYLGLTLLKHRKVSDMVLIRSAVESADSKLGYLPGTLDEKYSVYLTPFNDKFSELLNRGTITKLEKDNRLTLCPINFARGLHMAAKFICSDESQNMSKRELKTLLTRIGQFSKTIICGDPEQSDLPHGKSGFIDVYNLFNSKESRENGIFCVELTEDDIVRSEICKFIIKKFKTIEIPKTVENANENDK